MHQDLRLQPGHQAHPEQHWLREPAEQTRQEPRLLEVQQRQLEVRPIPGTDEWCIQVGAVHHEADREERQVRVAHCWLRSWPVLPPGCQGSPLAPHSAAYVPSGRYDFLHGREERPRFPCALRRGPLVDALQRRSTVRNGLRVRYPQSWTTEIPEEVVAPGHNAQVPPVDRGIQQSHPRPHSRRWETSGLKLINIVRHNSQYDMNLITLNIDDLLRNEVVAIFGSRLDYCGEAIKDLI